MKTLSLFFLTARSTSWAFQSALARSPTTARISRRHTALSSSTSTTLYSDSHETLPDFENEADYLNYLQKISKLPLGFATGTASGTFLSREAPALGELPIRATVIHLTQAPTQHWAAVFTSNKFPGAPILVGRQRVQEKQPLAAIVINNKVSNVCSGGDGQADAEMVCRAVSDALGLDSRHHVLPSSTGVIGWRLPAEELASDIVPRAVEALNSESALDAAKAICTTDRWPKVRSKTLSNGARIVGIAKGAGMIEPNMATMLAYIMTDADIKKKNLQSMLEEAVDVSFNSISVDGAESTSDTCVLVASNQVEGTDVNEFREALLSISKGLAADMVRNGEGTGHVMRVVITDYPGSDLEARRLGRHIVNSPLFKCAIAGNDPNTGRLAGAIGSYMGQHNPKADTSQVTLSLGGRTICRNGRFLLEGDDVEKELSDHMKSAQYDEKSVYPPHQRFVEIGVDFNGSGKGNAVILGSDLTDEYVAINADYRS
ncbi:hypothetical protein MPSEU_000310100 [Mayamaea pseudoterrestris]|nr:hypothetical protein MPSEU_000310100 [Mayamaea pseudoterrestris]